MRDVLRERHAPSTSTQQTSTTFVLVLILKVAGLTGFGLAALVRCSYETFTSFNHLSMACGLKCMLLVVWPTKNVSFLEGRQGMQHTNRYVSCVKAGTVPSASHKHTCC